MNKKIMLGSLILLLFATSFCFAAGERYWLRGVYPQGTYGITYNPNTDRIYYVNYTTQVIYIASSDSFVTSYGTIPAPNNDSGCIDLKYCSYDNTFWVLNKRHKAVYKINTSGTVLRSFSVSYIDYPCGLAWDNTNRQIYISDRRTTGGQTQYIYCVDTMGTVIRQMTHPYQGAYYGARCLDYVPAIGSNPAHLLNAYTFFNSSSTLDSAGVFALNPLNCQKINFFRLYPADSCNIRGVVRDPRDGTYWLTLYQYGT
ncbi:MAG: hypothetical protein ABIL69_00655 [candidate division WOR-3 bacterium]